MPYWQLFYHLVWSTKHRAPLLAGEVEVAAHAYLRDRAAALGAGVLAMGGAADHVHMVVSIPPRISVATFVGQIKAVSSSRINRAGICAQPFFWQEEYSAFSLDSKRLAPVVSYVERQRQHHARQTTVAHLEPLTDQPPGDDGLTAPMPLWDELPAEI